MARFVLAHPDPQRARGPVMRNRSRCRPIIGRCRQVAAQGHADLLVLERVVNEKTGKLFTVIRVDDVRRTVSFFGSTAGEGGWRICIVDSADELQYPQAANALLKILEEPPPNSLLILVSHAPARLLPTIRSRCRRLMLRHLTDEDVARGVAQALGREPGDPQLMEAAALAEGSIGRALTLLDGPALALRKRVVDMLDRLPSVDPQALHALGDALGGYEPQRLASFVDAVNEWLSTRLSKAPDDNARMLRIAETWGKVNHAARDADEFNLERKPLVFSVFGWLADAAR